jgi:outer membrane protein OmpA-like peptidoglycan-associated protein
MAKADVPTFSDKKEITNVVSSANYQINFKTGSADFTPEANEQLNKILSDALVATNLRIKINGHTDNVGSPDLNMSLSQRRADAVKNWLISEAASRFKGNRIQTFAFGQNDPIAPNTTPSGQAKNRRVEIVMGSTE